MDSLEQAKYIIENNQLMTLATADNSGKPWISPVGCVCDKSYNLYWVSQPSALHSQNVRDRSEVAIVIIGKLPDGSMDAVYYDATAEELDSADEINPAIDILKEREQDEKFKIKSIADVTGDAVWRIYKATPKKVYKRADSSLNGQAITVREPIDLV